MNEVIKYEGFTEEEQNVLAPYLLEMEVGCRGGQKMVFYFPEPNPLQIDLDQIETRFKYWEVELDYTEMFTPKDYPPRLRGTKITIGNIM